MCGSIYKPPKEHHRDIRQRQLHDNNTEAVLTLSLTVDVILPEGQTDVKCPGRGRT